MHQKIEIFILNQSEKNKAVFLDRDGTVNLEVGYINHPSRFELLPNAANAIRKLNQLGYGTDQQDLVLNLVYNPQGPDLPPGQQQLEHDYKTHLMNKLLKLIPNSFIRWVL